MKNHIIKFLKSEFPDKKIVSVNEPIVLYKNEPVPMYSLLFEGRAEMDAFTDFVYKDSTVVFVYQAEVVYRDGCLALILRTNQI